MPRKLRNRVPEAAVAWAILEAAAARDDGFISYADLRSELPAFLPPLTDADRFFPLSHPKQCRWHQTIRNVATHSTVRGNPINRGWLIHVPREGFKITPAGRQRLSEDLFHWGK